MLAMIFEKPSTRTRVSFDVGMRQLGGETIMLTGAEMQLGRGETIADTARVLSRYVDAIMIRILNHDALLELAEHATVPVINGLTRRSHPCQVMADVMTFEEHRGPIEGTHRGLDRRRQQRAGLLGPCRRAVRVQLNVATPPELAPKQGMRDWIKATGAPIDARHRSRGGRARRRLRRHRHLGVDGRQGRRAPPQPAQALSGQRQADVAGQADALFMHCLPAHRGEEVTDEVIDGPQSVVFDEAENRLHAQKGILAWCFDAVK